MDTPATPQPATRSTVSPLPIQEDCHDTRQQRLALASRVALGLEPGVLLRVRALRAAECIFEGNFPGDLRISLDADTRALPRTGVEEMLPVDPFDVPARVWAAALVAASAEVVTPARKPRRLKSCERAS